MESGSIFGFYNSVLFCVLCMHFVFSCTSLLIKPLLGVFLLCLGLFLFSFFFHISASLEQNTVYKKREIML